MNATSQFTSNFWNIYIAVIVLLSFIALAWLLLSQNVVKRPKKGEEVQTTGHEWDGIAEYDNPLPRWWFWLCVLTWLFGIGYLVMYPGVGDYKGLLKWTSHNQYEKEVKKPMSNTANCMPSLRICRLKSGKRPTGQANRPKPV